ncbi:MAG: hypothetical protein GF309_13655 [Candidatus Lokiarchaeota archaeon]|jgi:hypothetical protein|nr:hypothetical protein [Candidatus Lokiarchaeota archaeon]
MPGEKSSEQEKTNQINIQSTFRTSATVTFVVQIIAIIIMIGSLAAYLIGYTVFDLPVDIQILLLLIGSMITLMVFLGAIGLFIRFSRRVSDAVVGHSITQVSLDAPRVKPVLVLYGMLIALMGITGGYVWYLVDKRILSIWAASLNSVSLRIFGLALGAFFVALLIQIIVALVGRSATKVIVRVLDADDSEFLD